MDGLRTTFFLFEIDWSTFRESPRNEGFLPSGFGSAAKTGICPHELPRARRASRAAERR